MTREEKIAEVAKRREVLQAQRLEEHRKAAEDTRERVRLENLRLEQERRVNEMRLARARRAKELEEAEHLRKVQEIEDRENLRRRQERIQEVQRLMEKQRLLEEAEKAKEAQRAKEEAEAAAALAKDASDAMRKHRNWSKVPKEFQDKVSLGDLEDVNYLVSLQRAVKRKVDSKPADPASPDVPRVLPSV